MSGQDKETPGDDERRRARRLWIGLGVGFLVLAVAFGPGLVHLSERQMEMEAAKWPSTWRPVARAMAGLAASVPVALKADPGPLGDAWVPEAIRHLHGRVDAAPGRVTVTFGDRVHPFGYRLVPEPAQADATHLAWRFSYFSYRLDSPRFLETLRLPRSSLPTAADLARDAVRVLDGRLRRHPHDRALRRQRARLLAVLDAHAPARAAP